MVFVSSFVSRCAKYFLVARLLRSFGFPSNLTFVLENLMYWYAKGSFLTSWGTCYAGRLLLLLLDLSAWARETSLFHPTRDIFWTLRSTGTKEALWVSYYQLWRTSMKGAPVWKAGSSGLQKRNHVPFNIWLLILAFFSTLWTLEIDIFIEEHIIRLCDDNIDIWNTQEWSSFSESCYSDAYPMLLDNLTETSE